MFIYLFIYLFLYEALATINVLDKGILPLEKDSVGIQFFIDIDNADSLVGCTVHSWTKKCCLSDAENENCGKMYVYTASTGVVNPKDRQTLIHVYPTLVQHDQVGYCNFVLEFQCFKSKLKNKRVINIPFDTRISNKERSTHNLMVNYVGEQKSTNCETLDEDSLNNCRPVNCDLKYSGFRPFYDRNINKCVEAVTCEGNPTKELPDIVHVPNSNVCRDLESPLSVKDVYQITTGFYRTAKSESGTRKAEGMKVELKSNCSTISQNLNLIRDLMFGKLYPDNADTSSYGQCCKKAILKILACIVGICACLLSFVCCLHTSVWIYEKWRDGSLQEGWRDFKRKFKRQKKPQCSAYSYLNADITNSLLRQVIVRDIPIELRDSVVNICDRIGREVRCKRRYRGEEVGSQFNLNRDMSSDTCSSSSEDCDEQESLLK